MTKCQFMKEQRSESNTETEIEVFPPLVDESIVLTGPTAAGKSAVAVALAERLDAEILSLDSIAVYRKMNIGTATRTQLSMSL